MLCQRGRRGSRSGRRGCTRAKTSLQQRRRETPHSFAIDGSLGQRLCDQMQLAASGPLRGATVRATSISVSRYRSINDAAKVPLGDATVLIGRNNEGKSNFLRALQIAFYVIDANATNIGLSRLRSSRYAPYRWDRDFPVALKSKDRGRRDTTIRLALLLTDAEVDELVASTGVNLSPDLVVEVALSEGGNASVKVLKQGPAAKKLAEAIQVICKFISERFTFLYIPAVRTEQDSQAIIRTLLERSVLNSSSVSQFDAIADQIRALEQPTFDRIRDDVSATLQKFLPGVNSIRIERSSDDLMRSISRIAARDLKIFVNDGVDTELALKGDGVKSILALALFQHSVPAGTSALLAIEEPEAHLHSGAIRELKSVLSDVSSRSQVVISTHNPSFVSRDNPRQNLIVHKGDVRVAKNVREIRELMGIRASDALANADFAIVCEGSDDALILKQVLSRLSPYLSATIGAGLVAFEVLGGAGKLSYKLGTLKRDLVPFHVVMDNDAAGQNAIRASVQESLLEPTEYTLTAVPGLRESELEDVLDPAVYADVLQNKFGVVLVRNSVPGRDKWASRVGELFRLQGKLWDDVTKRAVKDEVSNLVAGSGADVILPARAQIMQHLATTLEAKARAALG